MVQQDFYDPGIIIHFRNLLVAQKVAVVAKVQRNGHPIFTEELNGAERMDRPQLVERHSLEIKGGREQLNDIEMALGKCDAGTYGLCSDCHQPILLARLEAIPTATRCVPCQAKNNKGRRATT